MGKDITIQEFKERLRAKGEPPWAQELLLGVPEGMRHASAVRLVGRYYGRGARAEQISEFLVVWNRFNLPPMSNSEIKSIFDSTTKWERPRGTFFMSDAEAREIVKEVRKQMRKRK